MRVLITGVTGFVGSWLAEYALARRAEVWGVKRWRSHLTNIQHIIDQIHLVDGDLTDPSAVRRVLEQSKPDFIFHLAAQSFVKCSFDQPRETFNTNVMSEINLLHGVREKLAGGIIVAGSSEEYGLVNSSECPIKETQPLRPLSPYAVSKVAQDLLAYQYHKSYGIRVVRARAFNCEGPRRGDVFVTSAFAKQCASIKLGQQPPIINVGNLTSVRDFTDVRDIVVAYWQLMEKGVSGDVYNIASGHAEGLEMNMRSVRQIENVLKTLLAISGLDDVQINQDETRLRPSDVPMLVGDFTKLHGLTGWTPTIPFKQTLQDTFDFWMRKLKIESGCLDEEMEMVK